jgi:hypothetical protein
VHFSEFENNRGRSKRTHLAGGGDDNRKIISLIGERWNVKYEKTMVCFDACGDDGDGDALGGNRSGDYENTPFSSESSAQVQK